MSTCKHRVVAKNCLKVAGTSPLDFLDVKGFLARLRWVRWFVHPLTKALNSISAGMSVLARSSIDTTLGWARNEHRLLTSSLREFPAKFK